MSRLRWEAKKQKQSDRIPNDSLGGARGFIYVDWNCQWHWLMERECVVTKCLSAPV